MFRSFVTSSFSIACRRRLPGTKVICALLCVGIVGSNLWTFSRWSERRGVYDDICYLRQAHLFQRFGLGGFDTDIKRDDDAFFATAQRDIGITTWSDPAKAACHVDMAMTGKRVLQYPPGPGFLLALFPPGFQVIPLYRIATMLVGALALVAIALATSGPAIATAAVFGVSAVYFMVNPIKSSYSLPPTMVVCAVVGYLTALMTASRDWRIRLATSAAAGLMMGISVNFRISNLFLASGFIVVLATKFVMRQRSDIFSMSAAFAVSMLIGIAPTLIANNLNAGSPLHTTYGGADVAGPAFDTGVILQYATNLQGVLIAIAILAALLLWRSTRSERVRLAVAIVGVNLVVNLFFFLSHPIYNSYYLMPIAMMSLWTLLFTFLLAERLPVRASIK